MKARTQETVVVAGFLLSTLVSHRWFNKRLTQHNLPLSESFLYNSRGTFLRRVRFQSISIHFIFSE